LLTTHPWQTIGIFISIVSCPFHSKKGREKAARKEACKCYALGWVEELNLPRAFSNP
jgi:hypothetical protein